MAIDVGGYYVVPLVDFGFLPSPVNLLKFKMQTNSKRVPSGPYIPASCPY